MNFCCAKPWEFHSLLSQHSQIDDPDFYCAQHMLDSDETEKRGEVGMERGGSERGTQLCHRGRLRWDKKRPASHPRCPASHPESLPRRGVNSK